MKKSDLSEADRIRVLVTRPEHQSGLLVLQLEQAGFQVELLPCLAISSLALDSNELAAEGFIAGTTSGEPNHGFQLTDYDAAIFTSSNAVLSLAEQFPEPWQTGNCSILAVGPTTAEQLENIGLVLAEPPKAPFNSEALLKSATLNSTDLHKVVIVKGTGGRDFLHKSLVKRGVKVFTLDTYKRFLPDIAETRLARVFLNSPVDIVTITSNETLNNLALLAGERYLELLLKLPLAVSSSRAADLAKELGFQNTIAVAEAPGNLGLIKTITNWKLSRDGI